MLLGINRIYFFYAVKNDGKTVRSLRQYTNQLARLYAFSLEQDVYLWSKNILGKSVCMLLVKLKS